MNELALFSGIGGGILGGKLLGWRTVCAVEINSFCARRLMQRQNEGHLPPFPIWDDVRTFRGHPWRGVVDVVSGGFPCQDISIAGKKIGIHGAKSGLWKEMQRIISEVRPRFVFVENSAALTVFGLGVVLGDLAAMGFDARWGVLGADTAIHSYGNPCADHERRRMWIRAEISDTASERRGEARKHSERQEERLASICSVHDANMPGLADIQGSEEAEKFSTQRTADYPGWWDAEPELDRVADGVADRVERGRAIGNGQVPRVAKLAWELLAT